MDSPRIRLHGRIGRSTVIAAVLAAAAVGTTLAACDRGPAAPSPRPSRATTEPSPSPPPSTAPATSLAPTTAPTTVPATSAPTTTPPAPDPRAVPVGSLVRPGTLPAREVYGDLDGDGVDDIALQSFQRHAPGVIPQQYLDVFLFDGEGGWPRAWEATGPAPPGATGAPVFVLQPADAAGAHQDATFVATVDMAGDGSADLVVGVLNLGAGPGPLDVWVIGFGPGGPTTEFWEETVQGGVLTLAGDTLRLQAPDFGPSDPACCPSRIVHQTIGFGRDAGEVRVLHQTFTPVG